MAEPLPSQSQSTAQPDTDDLLSATTNAEDRKAAAALSSLDARGDDDENDNGKAGAGKGVNNNIDQGTSITLKYWVKKDKNQKVDT